MKLIDFLESCQLFDGELYIKDGCESVFSFCWANDIEFTKIGRQEFKKILESPIIINQANIELQDTEIIPEMYDTFMHLTAGYVGHKYYDKILTEKKRGVD